MIKFTVTKTTSARQETPWSLVKLSTAILVSVALCACSIDQTTDERAIYFDKGFDGTLPRNVLVLALLEDERREDRLILEREVSTVLQTAGVRAIAGNLLYDSVDTLANNSGMFEPALYEESVASVLFIDPVKLTGDFDLVAYTTRRAAHAGLDMDTVTDITEISQTATTVEQCRVLINMGLWRPGDDRPLYHSLHQKIAEKPCKDASWKPAVSAIAEQVLSDIKSLQVSPSE